MKIRDCSCGWEGFGFLKWFIGRNREEKEKDWCFFVIEILKDKLKKWVVILKIEVYSY